MIWLLLLVIAMLVVLLWPTDSALYGDTLRQRGHPPERSKAPLPPDES